MFEVKLQNHENVFLLVLEVQFPSLMRIAAVRKHDFQYVSAMLGQEALKGSPCLALQHYHHWAVQEEQKTWEDEPKLQFQRTLKEDR